VVQDILPSETVELADVVLPGVSFAEKEGTYTNTERRVQMVRPAVPAPGEAWQDWRILSELAKRIQQRLGDDGVQGPYAGWDYASPEQIAEEAFALTPSYTGITYGRIQKTGLQWPCPNKEHPGTAVLHSGKFSRGLGRFVAVDWLPPAEQPDAEYPLVLTTGRILYHFHGGTMSRRAQGLEAIAPSALVEINPIDARALGVKNGQMVKVASRRGEIVAEAEVVERTDPGVVFMAFHYAEAAANLLTNPAIDPIAKIPEYKACAVRVGSLA
jgi:predicted molibdopterin-dependent oxidoreductase YjgC